MKYPHVKVKLIGKDGNAFAIIGSVTQAMKKAKIPNEEIAEFKKAAMGGDYNNLLTTCMDWVDVC